MFSNQYEGNISWAKYNFSKKQKKSMRLHTPFHGIYEIIFLVQFY